jgi:hypothetical protein
MDIPKLLLNSTPFIDKEITDAQPGPKEQKETE